jgi:hypothetical protein
MDGTEFREGFERLIEVISEAARLHLSVGLPDTKKTTVAAIQWRYPTLCKWHAEQCYDAALSLLNAMPTKK